LSDPFDRLCSPRVDILILQSPPPQLAHAPAAASFIRASYGLRPTAGCILPAGNSERSETRSWQHRALRGPCRWGIAAAALFDRNPWRPPAIPPLNSISLCIRKVSRSVCRMRAVHLPPWSCELPPRPQEPGLALSLHLFGGFCSLEALFEITHTHAGCLMKRL